jgi:arginyl-tRNA---protein transferase
LLPFSILDPESMTWDPLEEELSEKLDKRPYVSLSRDRKRLQSATAENPEPDDAGAVRTKGTKGTEEVADEEINDEEVSLFDIHMPGVMTAEEVHSQIDLDHWLLLVHGSFVNMNVSFFFFFAFSHSVESSLPTSFSW